MTTEPCLDCTKLLIQATVSKVVYWRPYTLPRAESQALRAKMRDHAEAEADIHFVQWQRGTNVIDLDGRYDAIRQRLAEHVKAYSATH